jgi:hypothetical protein
MNKQHWNNGDQVHIEDASGKLRQDSLETLGS